MEKVTAYRAFGVFADYDGNAPDTDTLVTVTSEELAKQVCEKLNEDPRSCVVAFVDGWEHAKRFRYRPVLVANPNSGCDSYEQALAEMLQE